jgi:hypothetical protein
VLHQLNFDGEEVQGVYVEIMKSRSIPLDDVWDSDEELKRGDHVEVILRGAIADVNHGAKTDTDGIEIGELRRTYKILPMTSGLKIRARLSKADRDEAWDREHGALA